LTTDALVQAGISPAQISAAVPSLGNRLFRSAEGLLDSEQFVAAVARQWEQRGKSFDASRYFFKEEFCRSISLLSVFGATIQI